MKLRRPGVGALVLVWLMVACGSDGGGATDTTDVPAYIPPPPHPAVTAVETHDLGDEPVALVAADLDGDGDIDLAVGHQFANALQIFIGAGDGTFTPTPQTPTPGRTVALVAADFDEDGIMDLAMAADDTPELRVLFGAGDGSFPEDEQITVPALSGGLAAADMDGNGHLDLISTDRGFASQPSDTLSVVPGDGDGTFDPPLSSQVGDGPSGLAVVDLNADSRPDVALAYLDTEELGTFLGDGDGRVSALSALATSAVPLHVAAGQLAGTALPDLVATNTAAATLSFVTDPGTAEATTVETLPTCPAPYAVLVHDGNGDDRGDVYVSCAGNGTVVFHGGDAEGEFTTETLVTIQDAARLGPMALADFDGDGHADIAVVERGRSGDSGTLHIFRTEAP